MNAFQKLVEERGEVTRHGLRHRIENAAALVFIGENECVAVGAIKRPNENYKKDVFSKAGVADKRNDFNFELGWLYVKPKARGKGLGHILMKAVVEYLEDSGCYATTREHNDSVHRLFTLYNFNQVGAVYSSNYGYSLELYTNRP